MEQKLLELLGGGAFAFLVIKEVLSFVKTKMANGDHDKWKFELLNLQTKQTTLLTRQTDILNDLKDAVSSTVEKINALGSNLNLAMDRQVSKSEFREEIEAIKKKISESEK